MGVGIFPVQDPYTWNVTVKERMDEKCKKQKITDSL